MSMEINNEKMSDSLVPSGNESDNNDISDSRVFDDSKLAKLNGIRSQGLNPYPYKFEKNGDICEIQKKFEDFEKNEGLTVRTAGRLYNIRRLGKMIFADLGDQGGRIQITLRKGNLPDEDFKTFKTLVDSGDIVGVQGTLFRTKRGENSISVSEFSLLSKSLCALPEKFHGLKDVETRDRKSVV